MQSYLLQPNSMTKITQKGAVTAIQGGGGGEESKYSENYTLGFMNVCQYILYWSPKSVDK